jgi:hypothetical protein
MYENTCSGCSFFVGLPVLGTYADYEMRECPKGGMLFGQNPLKSPCTSYRNTDEFRVGEGHGNQQRRV